MKKIIILFLFFAIDLNAQVKFADIGDYGCDDPNELAVSVLVKSWNPDFIITNGDNNYYALSNGDSIDYNVGRYYHEYISPYLGHFGSGSTTGNRFFTCLGNHDFYDGLWYGDNDIRYAGYYYYNYFKLTDTVIHKGNTPDTWSPLGVRYYKFTKGNVQFFMMNSGVAPWNHSAVSYSEPDGIDSNSVQAQWLKTQLRNSTAKWKIVVFHHAPYSSVPNGQEDMHAVLRWNFKQWGASAVINGHNHTYESVIVDGFPYFINGLGGEDKNLSLAPTWPGSRVQYLDKYGAMQCVAYADSLTFKFINVDNELIDYYKLVSHNNDAGVNFVERTTTGAIYTGVAQCFNARVKNFGINNQFFIPVSFKVNGGPPVGPFPTGGLNSGDSTLVSFCGSQSFIPPAAGSYTLKFFTSLAGDLINTNDTTTLVLTVADSSKDAGVTAVTTIPSGTIYTGSNVSFRSKVKNFGLANLPVVPVKYTVNGGPPAGVVNTGALNSGDTTSVIFTSFTPAASGNYTLKFFTALSGDTVHSNDTTTFILTAVDSSKDVGVTAVTTIPSGTIYTGSNVSFRSKVKNFGLANLPVVPVTYTVNDGSPAGVVNTGALNSGDTTSVIFTSFTPAASGNYTLKFFTALSGDTVHSNDTTTFILTAVDSSKDVGVTAVANIPSGTIYTGTNISFHVVVKNFGLANLPAVPVTYKINGGSPVGIINTGAINSGDTTSVLFTAGESFIPGSSGSYILKFFTELSGDADHNNDTTTLILTVVDSSRDAGVTAVTNIPSGTIYTGTNISFHAEVKNFGLANLPAVPVTYKINGGSPVGIINTGAINSGDTTSVLFTAGESFTPASSGSYVLKFFTELAGDADHANDTTTLILTVIDSSRDAGVTAVTNIPSGTIYTGTNISFHAEVKNFGLANLPAVPVTYKINGGSPVGIINTGAINSGDTNSVLFTAGESYTPASPGSYVLKFFTELAGDADHANDTTTLILTVIDSIRDAGVTAVTNIPSGTIYTGTNISFHAEVKNFGLANLPAVPVTYKINGGSPVGIINTGAINSGDTNSVLFTAGESYTPASSGSYVLKFFTELAGDADHANDTTTLVFTVIDSSRDAGVIAVTSIPSGIIYKGTNLSFRTEVKNFGLANLPSVPASYTVNGGLPVGIVNTNALNSGDTATVLFTAGESFTPEVPGSYIIKFFTELSEDITHANDTTTLVLSVFDSSKDAGVVSVTSIPPGIIYTGTNVTFRTLVKDFGIANLSQVPVKYTVNDGSPVDSMDTGPLSSGDTILVLFNVNESFTPAAPGSYTLKFFTSLAGDTIHSNDTATIVLTVIDSSRDAGVIAVTSIPSGIIYTGTTISFHAEVKNFGLAHLASMPVSYITNGDSVIKSVNSGPVNSGDSTSVLFNTGDSFTPGAAGSYTLKFFTSLAGDTIHSNDTTTVVLTVINPASINIKIIPQGFYNNLTGKLNLRDTVKIFLRNTDPPFNIVDSSVSEIDSNTYQGVFTFSNAANGTYYIVIKHRNTIETWSRSGGEPFTVGTTMNYDFTDSSNKAFGNNLIELDSLERFAIYSGDVNQDGTIDLSDIIMIYNQGEHFQSGYVNEDITGDLFVDLNDLIMAYNNSDKFARIISP